MGDFIFRYGLVAIGVLEGLVLIAGYFARNSLVFRHEHSTLQSRVEKLETAASTDPGWGVIEKLKANVGELDGALRGLREKVEGLGDAVHKVDRTVSMINEHLLSSK